MLPLKESPIFIKFIIGEAPDITRAQFFLYLIFISSVHTRLYLAATYLRKETINFVHMIITRPSIDEAFVCCPKTCFAGKVVWISSIPIAPIKSVIGQSQNCPLSHGLIVPSFILTIVLPVFFRGEFELHGVDWCGKLEYVMAGIWCGSHSGISVRLDSESLGECEIAEID